MTQVIKDVKANGDARLDSALAKETSSPVVSVIMPAYNVAVYIAEALDSVLAQTFDDYEIIVVNDGSPDTAELERVLEPYHDRIVYIKQENRGLSGARNTAVRAARGEFIALLDPDDAWETDYLAAQISSMRDDPTLDVVYANAVLFGDARDAGREFMDICPSEGEVTFESLITTKCNVMVSVLARRETVVRVGMFDEALRSSEDFDLWLRVVKAGGRIAYHRRPLVRYRRRPGSLSSDAVWMCQSILRVLEKSEKSLSLTPSERETLAREKERFRAMIPYYEGKTAFLRGDAKAAIEHLETANRYFNRRKFAVAIFGLRHAPRMLRRAFDLRERWSRRKVHARA